MDNLTIENLNVSEKRLFSYLHEIDAIPFFEEILTVAELDNLFTFLHGSRKLSNVGYKLFIDGVDSDSMTRLATLISNMFSRKWALVSELLKIETGVHGFGITETKTVTIDDKDSGLVTKFNTNVNHKQTSAYDVEGFSDKDKSTEEFDDTITSDNQKDKIISTSKLVQGSKDSIVKDRLQMIQYYKIEMYEIVFQDITNTITSMIF